MSIDGTVRDRHPWPPGPIDQLRAAQDATGIAHEDLQDAELLRRHVDRRALAAQFRAIQIELALAESDDALARVPASAQLRADARARSSRRLNGLVT